ncbi:MAG: hypothetical protein K6G91_12435 [Kiritimatiellae bacterium]|nr:hypothetical protein [Kiritimatiellia bacterium]
MNCLEKAKIAREKKREAKRKYMLRCSQDVHVLTEAVSQALRPPVSLAVLAKATTKPEGVSDVRWRIELRRRAKARAMGKWGHFACMGMDPERM